MKITECKCKKCQSFCSHLPGRFMPEEIKKTAQYLKLSNKEFFNKYLGVNYWVKDKRLDINEKVIYFISPKIISMEDSKIFPFDSLGICIFFKNGLCEIHKVKPYECKVAYHDNNNSSIFESNLKSFIEIWRHSQDLVIELYGGIPKIKEPTILEMLDFMTKRIFHVI